MKTIFRWFAVLLVLSALLPEGVSAQAPDPPKPSGEIAPVQLPAEVTNETSFSELPKGGSPSGPPWTVQRIDDRHFFSGSASKHYLKIDSTGKPHIVYGGDHLYHTWWNSIWYTEVVDSALNVGSYASLAIDGQDKLHIAYYDAGNQDLKYATNAFGGWYITTIASTGDVGAGTDIGVDAYQDPYFVYRDSTHYDLLFAAMTNGVMEEPEIINGDIFVGDMFSMAARNPLDVHVIFYSIYDTGSAIEGELYYTTTRTTTRWQPNLVYSGDFETGRVADIALDLSGNPHVVFGVKIGELMVSRYFASSNFGGSWLPPFGNGDVVAVGLPDGLALALDSSNMPHIAMQSGGTLLEYYRSGSAWALRAVDPGTGTGFYPAIALYPSTSTNFGNPAFAYLDDPASKIIHLNYREIWSGSWWPVDGPAQVDQSEKVGWCSTSLTGPDGNPWLVYSGDTTKKLYFKRFYNGAWTTPQEIGSEYTGTINCFHAAAAGGGKAAVLFTTEDAYLLYSTIICTGAACVVSSSEVIHTDLATPRNFIDLILDANGYPHMVYLIESGSNRQLVYLYDIGAGWVARFGPEIITPSASGRPVSIKRTAGGVLHIAYQKNDLWDSSYYVNYSRGAWSAPLRLSVDNEEVVNGVSVSLNSAGDPGVVYTDITDPSQLNLMQRTCGTLTCTWPASPFVVDTWSDFSAFYLPSMTTDSLGRYRLSYVQTANGSLYLQYVRINGPQMEFRNVYQYPGLGIMSSLALSPMGVGRISFNDAYNGDLMFAWQNVQLFLPMVKK